MDWQSNKLAIGSGLAALFILTFLVSRPFVFDRLLSFIGVSVGGTSNPLNTAGISPGPTSTQKINSKKLSVTPTNQVRVTSDTNLVSPSPVGVTSDTNSPSPSNISNNNNTITSPLVVVPVESALSPVIVSSTLNPVSPQSTLININTAGLEELEKITGVGPVIGQRIIDYRQTNGPFRTIQDIVKVKGIGDKTFDKMKDQITVGN